MDVSTSTSPKIDVYQMVTDQIIALLEKGVVPWQKPWKEAGMPINFFSKRPYKGINLWLLLSLNYERNLFLTWDQIKSMGASVNQGEHGHIVVFWKPAKNKENEELDEKKKPAPLLRYYKVFNIAQCRDIPEHLFPDVESSLELLEPMKECEAIISGMPDPPTIVHRDPHAYYRIDTDTINMPKKKSFKTIEGYYSTLFHELVHSTGAEKRLRRNTLMDMVPFGAKSYVLEELVAEMGSAFLCHLSGILLSEITNKVAYLDNWLSVIKKDKRLLMSAAGLAQRAVDFVQGIK